MEPSTRTLAPITSTNEAKASMSTASSTASRTSDSPSKSPLWRLPPDVLTTLQPSYWTRRSSHGPPDGGRAGAVPPAGFVLGDLLDDLQRPVRMAAACALGLMGRNEVRPLLARYLREEPSAQLIDAVAPVADEEGIILLGRIG